MAGRLWIIDRRSRIILGGDGKIRQVLLVIVESGAVYTANQIVFLILYLCSNNALYNVADCVSPINVDFPRHVS